MLCFARFKSLALGLLTVLLLLPLTSSAQTYPMKPIHLIVPFPPGGVADLIARPVAERIGQLLGQPVVVENRGGATGTIGAAYVAHSAPDGYTLLFGTTNEIAMSPTLYKSLPYDPTKAFAPVTPVAEFPNVLVVNPDLPVKNFEDLIELARKRGKNKGLSFASSGEGSTNHLTAELFKRQAKVEILHVPFKGGGPGLVALMGGSVDAMFATLPSAIALIRSGKLKALVVTGERRSSALPEVPTAKEAGMPGLVVTTWNGVLAPAGTPPAIVDRLHDALTRAVTDPGIKQKLATVGAEVATEKPDTFAAQIDNDFARWSAVIRQAGIKVD